MLTLKVKFVSILFNLIGENGWIILSPLVGFTNRVIHIFIFLGSSKYRMVHHKMGHASPSTTINIYGGEMTSKMGEIAAQALDDLITPVSVPLHQRKRAYHHGKLSTSISGGAAFPKPPYLVTDQGLEP